MDKRPNIIFLQNDHQAHYRWDWNDEAKAKRPNFERVKAKGAVFNNTYCSTPLCGPTRRSILTGLYSHTHGQYHNYTDPPYEHEVYLNALAEAGYENYYFGKWHAGPGNAKDHNCKGFSETGYGNPYITEEYKEYLKKNNLPEAVHHIKKKFTLDDFEENGMFEKLQEGKDYQCKTFWCGEHAIGVTTTPKETHESFFLADLACDKLEELAKKDKDEPFALRVDFWGPHQPHFPTQEYLDMYKDMQIPEYGSFNSKLKDKPKFYHTERSYPLGNNDKIKIPSPLDWKEWQDIIKHCFAHISMVDAAGGKIIDKLEELGMDDNTLLIWTTDHGDALTSHGGHFDKGSYLSEEVVRIPLAMSWPNKIPAGQEREEYISTVDLPVTILDAAGTQFSKNKVHGESILPLLIMENSTWRKDIISETHGHGYGQELIGRMIVYNNYKYIYNKGYIDELYNLEKDPYELNNLIKDKKYEKLIIDMRNRLEKWQEATDDPERITLEGGE